jgi:Predicted membrane protein (DUF2339)
MEFVTALIAFIAIALWVRSSNLKRRLRDLEETVGNYAPFLDRIGDLERQIRELRAPPPPPPPPSAAWEPAPHIPPMPPVHVEPLPDIPPVVVAPIAPSAGEPAAPPPPPPPPPMPEWQPEPEPEPVAEPVFSLTDTLREKLSSEEWEALVGGSLLNKLGILIMVIAIALGLSYSATRLGPAGRVALALGISFIMIAGGVILERRGKYLVFARGLLGGGWAALYLTAYGMHALDAARVIDSPLVGAILLIAVAAGMIAHSLRYRSQVVTGLAYFAAFAALAITPVAAFSVVALVPLAISLLVIAWRFEWFAMALFGLVATYGTCASKATGTASVGQTQAILGTYWLLFEIFDVLRAAKRKPAAGACGWIAPLNALAALGMSYLKWSATPEVSLWMFFAGAAALYLADAVVRALVRPPATVPAAEFFERALSGYEGAITLAAALAVPAIFLGFTGLRVVWALLGEGEALFVAGLVFRQSWLRHLASGAFAIALLRLVFSNALVAGPPRIWTPTALLATALFYVNSALKRPGLLYSYAAAPVLVVILGFEVPPIWLGLAWMGLALALFEFGFWARLREFRLQSYAVAVLAWSILLALNTVDPQPHPWLTLGLAALANWLITAQMLFLPRFSELEHRMVRDIADTGGTFFAGALIWQVVPRPYLGLGWLGLAIVCLEAGIATGVRWFRREADIAGIVAIGTLAGINVFSLGGVPPHQLLSLGGAALLAYAAAVRMYRLDDGEHRFRRDVSLSAGSLFLAAVCWYLLPSPLIAVSWGVMALVLLEIGSSLGFRAATANGHVLAASGIGRLFIANFTITGNSLGISHRLLTVLPFAALCYYLHDLTLKAKDRLSRLYLWAGGILIVFLVRFELGNAMAVVGWAIFGVALLYFGHRLEKPDLRWQSYLLAIWTFIRSWTTNFYIPESLLGMHARVLTGAIVVAAFYASEFLSPREQEAAFRVKARTLFSCLATVLLSALLFYEVSGSLLTVAWGVEGIALLLAGFPLRERSLRLAGLALFFICISKLFFYDLSKLETGYRILSFLALGMLLIGASWVYTRFREQLKQLL